MGISPDKIHTTGRDILQEMASSALNGDIMVRKGVFFTIREWSYFFYCPVIYCQSIKVYRVEIMDMGRFCWNSMVSVKYNPSKYCGAHCKE